MGSKETTTGPVFEAIKNRMSRSKVTDEAPSTEDLKKLLSVLNAVADHSNLKPWRIIELRGKDRHILGEALAKASKTSAQKGISKATRAPLVLAMVVSPRKSKKVPLWEQEAVASGVAHFLGLLLEEAGWGTMWRTGDVTRHTIIRKAHQLEKGEELLGWIYVGGVLQGSKTRKPRKPLDMKHHLSAL